MIVPATEVMAIAHSRISTKFRWMPIAVGSAEESTWAWAVKKKLEPNQPIE